MQRNLWSKVVGLVAVAAVAGCSNTTEPVTTKAPDIALIKDISFPARAALMDTVRVAFTYVTPSCDTDLTLESKQTGDGLRFTARSVRNTGPCAFDLINVHHAGFLVIPPHEVPLRLIFAEPDGKDSLRVVLQP